MKAKREVFRKYQEARRVAETTRIFEHRLHEKQSKARAPHFSKARGEPAKVFSVGDRVKWTGPRELVGAISESSEITGVVEKIGCYQDSEGRPFNVYVEWEGAWAFSGTWVSTRYLVIF